MGTEKRKSIKSRIKAQAGETLVEAIISVAIFLIAMVGITGIVKTSTGINVETRLLSQEIEEAANQVEAGEWASQQDGEMTILFDDSTIIHQNITIKEVEPFVYFEPQNQ